MIFSAIFKFLLYTLIIEIEVCSVSKIEIKRRSAMIFIVEDVKKWEDLLVGRTREAFPDEEIVVARSVGDLERILTSDQKFMAVALDGWLGKDSTLRFIPTLLEKSQWVISTSQDFCMRIDMISVGCHAGGNKWDFVQILQVLSP